MTSTYVWRHSLERIQTLSVASLLKLFLVHQADAHVSCCSILNVAIIALFSTIHGLSGTFDTSRTESARKISVSLTPAYFLLTPPGLCVGIFDCHLEWLCYAKASIACTSTAWKQMLLWAMLHAALLALRVQVHSIVKLAWLATPQRAGILFRTT